MRSTTRRYFIRSVGIAVASLVMARCIPSGGKDDSPRGRLRHCWLRLDWLAEQAKGDYEQGDRAREELATDHHAALDDLVAAGEIDADVADELNTAFGAATNHVLQLEGENSYVELPAAAFTPLTAATVEGFSNSGVDPFQRSRHSTR